MSKVCKLCGYDIKELLERIEDLEEELYKSKRIIMFYKNINEINSKALTLACKTLNSVCMTQNYALGLGQDEKYFIKKAKENLKND